MFERVTYADLQFAGSRQEKSPGEGRGRPGQPSWGSPPRTFCPLTSTCFPEPDEGELTYENLQGPRAQGDLPPRAIQRAEGECSGSLRTPKAHSLSALGLGSVLSTIEEVSFE